MHPPQTGEPSSSDGDRGQEKPQVILFKLGNDLVRLLDSLGLLRNVGASGVARGAAALVVAALLVAVARLVLGTPSWPVFIGLILAILLIAFLYRLVEVALGRKPGRIAADAVLLAVVLLIIATMVTGFTAIVFHRPEYAYDLFVKLTIADSQKSVQEAIKQAESSAINKTAEQAAQTFVVKQLTSTEPTARVLWIDDHPERILRLKSAFEQSLGMSVKVITDTDKILPEYQALGQHFDVVITDMGRGQQQTAGLITAKLIHDHFPGTPVIIYTSRARDYRDIDGVGLIYVTDRPQRLLELLTEFVVREHGR